MALADGIEHKTKFDAGGFSMDNRRASDGSFHGDHFLNSSPASVI